MLAADHKVTSMETERWVGALWTADYSALLLEEYVKWHVMWRVNSRSDAGIYGLQPSSSEIHINSSVTDIPL
jgi:hypothetical protein